MAEFSKSQVDRLGERLRKGPATEDDLRMLDDYRRSFSDALTSVLQLIRRHGFAPTSRIAKTTHSIVEKLQREGMLRLSRMQDVAGCRVIVHNIAEQDEFVATLQLDLPGSRVMDRRKKPSHDYRAVHVIAKISEKQVEVQVRTPLQHLWAELSEKSSDVIDPMIKYGGGSESWRTFLTETAQLIKSFEDLEIGLAVDRRSLKRDSPVYNEMKGIFEQDEKKLRQWRNEIANELRNKISSLKTNSEDKNRDFLD